MKILDIITPHETLDEGTAADWLAKGGKKVKDIANDVGELTGIRALRTSGSNKIADYVEKSLKDAGKDLRPSKALKAAEKELLDLENTISLEPLSKERFDQMAEYLATKLKAEDRTLHGMESPIVALQGFIKNEPNPQSWMNSKQIKDNIFNNEFQEWLTKSTNARVKIKQEVELAPPAPPPPKSKEEKEAETRTNKEKEVADKELTAREKTAEATIAKAGVEIEKNKKIGNALERWLRSLSALDKTFLSAEAIRIIVMNWQRWSDINRWEASGDIPQEIAQYFPEVKSPGTRTWGGPDKKTEYATNEQRVHSAAFYSKVLIGRQLLLQLGALGGGLLAANKLLKLGGGTMNYASQMKYVLYVLTYVLVPLGKGMVLIASKIPGGSSVVANAGWISKISIEGLKGISQAGKIMMVDYLAAAVNPDQPYLSQPLTDLSNKLSTVPAYKNIQIDHPPDINDAVLGLFTASLFSIEGFATSPTVKTLIGTYDASLVPAKIFLDTLGAIWNFFDVPVPEIDINMPPAGGKLPGVNPTDTSQSNTQQVVTEPPNRAPSDVNASQDQTSMSGDNKGGTTSQGNNNTSRSNNNNNVKTNKDLIPSDSGHLEESINESLKRRVAQLMKS